MSVLINSIIQDVAELPDRTSPDDQQDMMLVSEKELRTILEARLCPHPDVQGTEPLILYFTTDADRDEFIAAVQKAKPSMRAVKV